MKKVVLLLLCLCIVSSVAIADSTLTIYKSVITTDKNIGGTFNFKVTSSKLNEPKYVTVVVDPQLLMGFATIENLPTGTYIIEEIDTPNGFSSIAGPVVIRDIIKENENVTFINILKY